MPDDTNLFHWATSELSQDAFICWLLSHADNTCAAKNPAMHNAGLMFLNAFMHSAGEAPLSSATVKVIKQLMHCDIVAEINSDLILIIEDKTSTSEHGQQLRRYRESIGEKYKDRKILCFYCKTGNQSDFTHAEKQGYKPFLRKNLLDVLRNIKAAGTEHDVINDFLEYLEDIEKKTQAFLVLPPDQWDGRAWQGFFMALQSVFTDLRWNYVPNQSGGFTGAWWHFMPVPNVEGWRIYLQAEEKRLVAKIICSDKNPDSKICRNIRERCFKALDLTSRNDGIKITRPGRSGNGRSMTAAIITDGDQDWLKLHEDGIIDMNATIGFLRKALVFLDRTRTALLSHPPAPAELPPA
ncbi:PD-(D/E)XK nuclease family protein [Acetobacter sp. AN02]|uniref:PD-(D/E)XK nuclease family protein n=1 Tax=Acetobacter sp. AN02 TaxID=2894186 RepID=UPI00243459ED|nr:PD-(D/E)XK nuclease family protein [Acetobacter sp. AN02]MDG6094993.1 PD-(D/E)XK nuclease family protein [Acetobacter sp. AN02]